MLKHHQLTTNSGNLWFPQQLLRHHHQLHHCHHGYATIIVGKSSSIREKNAKFERNNYEANWCSIMDKKSIGKQKKNCSKKTFFFWFLFRLIFKCLVMEIFWSIKNTQKLRIKSYCNSTNIDAYILFWYFMKIVISAHFSVGVISEKVYYFE